MTGAPSNANSDRTAWDIASELEDLSHNVRDYAAFIEELLEGDRKTLGERTIRGIARVIQEIGDSGARLIEVTDEVYDISRREKAAAKKGRDKAKTEARTDA